MPQPFWTKKIVTYVTGDIAPARPQHAMAALRIITTAAETEAAVGKVLVTLSPQNGRRLAEHYNEQTNEAKKGATVQAIASVLLSEPDQALLWRILAKHKSTQRERAPFAHWHYAFTDEDPDLLILINPKDELLSIADDMYIQHNWIDNQMNPASKEAREEMLAAQEQSRAAAIRSAWCYTLAELGEIEVRLTLVRVLMDLFQRVVTWKGAQSTRDELLRQIEMYLEQAA